MIIFILILTPLIIAFAGALWVGLRAIKSKSYIASVSQFCVNFFFLSAGLSIGAVLLFGLLAGSGGEAAAFLFVALFPLLLACWIVLFLAGGFVLRLMPKNFVVPVSSSSGLVPLAVLLLIFQVGMLSYELRTPEARLQIMQTTKGLLNMVLHSEADIQADHQTDQDIFHIQDGPLHNYLEIHGHYPDSLTDIDTRTEGPIPVGNKAYRYTKVGEDYQLCGFYVTKNDWVCYSSTTHPTGQ